MDYVWEEVTDTSSSCMRYRRKKDILNLFPHSNPTKSLSIMHPCEDSDIKIYSYFEAARRVCSNLYGNKETVILSIQKDSK